MDIVPKLPKTWPCTYIRAWVSYRTYRTCIIWTWYQTYQSVVYIAYVHVQRTRTALVARFSAREQLCSTILRVQQHMLQLSPTELSAEPYRTSHRMLSAVTHAQSSFAEQMPPFWQLDTAPEGCKCLRVTLRCGRWGGHFWGPNAYTILYDQTRYIIV